MRKAPQPRESRFALACHYPGDTWIESEILCGPRGGKRRRARVKCPDGKLRVVRCGLADTFFSIPAVGGYLVLEDYALVLKRPNKKL